MKNPIIVAILSFILLAPRMTAVAAEFDEELSNFATKLSAQINDKKKQKITVLDFTDLQGASSELGRYIAEELTVNLVVGKREFAVLDRANLNSILAEHKLTATGLVDPENAKKLGAFAGVDALVLGNLVPLGPNIQIIAKVISTDTAEIIGAAKCLIQTNATITALLEKPTEPKTLTAGASSSQQANQNPTNSIGDLKIDFAQASIANGEDYKIRAILHNLNEKKSIWVAVEQTGFASYTLGLTDENGYDFRPVGNNSIIGIEAANLHNGGIMYATEVRPKSSINAFFQFHSYDRKAVPSKCMVRIGLLISHDFNPKGARDGYNVGSAELHHVVTDLNFK